MRIPIDPAEGDRPLSALATARLDEVLIHSQLDGSGVDRLARSKLLAAKSMVEIVSTAILGRQENLNTDALDALSASPGLDQCAKLAALAAEYGGSILPLWLAFDVVCNEKLSTPGMLVVEAFLPLLKPMISDLKSFASTDAVDLKLQNRCERVLRAGWHEMVRQLSVPEQSSDGE